MNHPNELLLEAFAERVPSLRIAVVTETFPPEVNGVAMTFGRIVEGLLQRGHAVQLVRPRQAKELLLIGNTPSGLSEVLSPGLPVPGYGELRFGLPSKNRLVKLWSETRPDVVHVVTEGPLGWSAVAAAHALNLPVTSSFHTNFQSYSAHYGIGFFKKIIEGYLRRLHNRTHATLVPTHAMVSALQAQGYHNVGLMSRGVAIEQFSPAKRSAALRQSWGVADDALVVLHVGRLAKEKNIALVIAAYQAIRAQVPTASMVFVGDGPLRKQVQEACPEAIFAGVRKGEDLARHYASGDLFLFPSLTETFGNVVPEALASGLAVLAYTHAAAKELIVSGQNGVLVPGINEQNFVNAAVALAADSALVQQLRQAAATSVAHLDWDAVYDSFVDTLSGVMERHGRLLGPAQVQKLAAPLKTSSA